MRRFLSVTKKKDKKEVQVSAKEVSSSTGSITKSSSKSNDSNDEKEKGSLRTRSESKEGDSILLKAFAGPEIRPSDIDIVKIIASGKQGYVAKAVVFGHQVAVKEILFDKDKNPQVQIENFKAEVKMMSEIHHPNRACLEQSKWRLVTELCKNDLDSIINDKKKFNELSLFDKIEMAKDIAMGMSWLHEIGICHLDLKPKNILVDKHGVLKVADFGYSRLFGQNPHNLIFTQENLVLGGSPIYMAPERLQSSRNFQFASDVYSFAIIFWEILTGGVPYEGHNDLTAFKAAVIRDRERPSLVMIRKVCGEDAVTKNVDLINLITSMWNGDFNQRPSFREVVDRLDKLLISAAVSDEGAQQFWKDNFYKATKSLSSKDTVIQELQVEISWDIFAIALTTALRPSLLGGLSDYVSSFNELPPQKLLGSLRDHPTPEQIKSATPKALDAYKTTSILAYEVVQKEKLRRYLINKVMRLKTLLIDGHNAGYVHISRFGKICDTLGPWVINLKGGILETISSLMKHGWFYGYLSKEESYEKLKNKQTGTFLIRFGATQNRIVVSRVVTIHTEKKVVHNRVKCDSEGFSLPGRKVWPTIEQLVEGERDVLKNIYAPEHPLSTFASEDRLWSNEMAVNTNYYTEPDDMDEMLKIKEKYEEKKKERLQQKYKEGEIEKAKVIERENLYSPRHTESTGISLIKKELEELEAQKVTLLALASAGQGGDTVYKQLGELLVKMELNKKKLQNS